MNLPALIAGIAVLIPAASAEGGSTSSDDVRRHTVEERAFASEGRHELTAYPFTAQVGSAWTRHFGAALAYTYHFTERFAVQASPFFNYVSGESGFQRELIDKASIQSDAATALLLRWGATAGIELSPIDGKFVFGRSVLGHFSLSLTLGAGAAGTRVQLSEGGFGGTGVRFIGTAGISARLALAERVAIRLELKDFIAAARISKINGCTYSGLTALEEGGDGGRGCHASGLSELERSNARQLLEEPSSSVLNHLSLLLGVSVLF